MKTHIRYIVVLALLALGYPIAGMSATDGGEIDGRKHVILTARLTIESISPATIGSNYTWEVRGVNSSLWQTIPNAATYRLANATLPAGFSEGEFVVRRAAIAEDRIAYSNETRVFRVGFSGIEIDKHGESVCLYTDMRLSSDYEAFYNFDNYNNPSNNLTLYSSNVERSLPYSNIHLFTINLGHNYTADPYRVNVIIECLAFDETGENPEGERCEIGVIFLQQPIYNHHNIFKGEVVVSETFNDGGGYAKTATYFDKFGRTEQNINVGATPNGYDIVDFYDYDSMGRADSISYMPYIDSELSGTHRRVNVLGSQQNYFQTAFPGDPDRFFAYSATLYDESPLGLVKKKGSVGADYRIDIRPVEYNYRLGKLTEICKFKIVRDSVLQYCGYYLRDSLVVKEIKSPVSANEFVYSYEYINAEGQLVARANSTIEWRHPHYVSEWRVTHYAYDDMGRQRYIIPPIARTMIISMDHFPSSQVVRNYCYYTEYDKYGRITKSLNPGTDWVYIIYDKMDRVVMTQDGNMRKRGEWAYIIYDDLNRPASQHIVRNTSNLTHVQIQEGFNAINYICSYPTTRDSWRLEVPFDNNSFEHVATLSEVRYQGYEYLQLNDDDDTSNALGYIPCAF